MTKSQRELTKIKRKSGGSGKKRDKVFSFTKRGLLTARHETGLLFSFTSAIHSPYWAFLSDLSLLAISFLLPTASMTLEGWHPVSRS